MAQIWGRKISKAELTKHLGRIGQAADMQPCVFADGKARDTRVIKVNTGSGLTFDIIPDRGMDIGHAAYKGVPLAFLSQSDICGSEYFVENGDKGYLDNFFAGLLTTSGLSNIGASNTDEGKAYGLHGTISNIPANNVNINKKWDGDEYLLSADGIIHQGRFKGEDFELHRNITTYLGANKLMICDVVENIGLREEPFMLMYHMNFGFPFVSPESELFHSESELIPRTEEAGKGIDTYADISAPISDYREQCYYHVFNEEEVVAGLFNPQLGEKGMGLYIKYNKAQLPYFCQWKQMGEQEYIMGFIPGTWFAEGRNEARQSGELKTLRAGEKHHVNIEVGVFEGRKNF